MNMGKAQADKVSIGLDLTARSLQKALKDGGLPWEKSKSFDGSAYVAEAFTALESFPPGHHIDFLLKRNGIVVQSGHNGQMIFPIDKIIAVGPIEAGDRLEGYLLGELLFDLTVEQPKAPASHR